MVEVAQCGFTSTLLALYLGSQVGCRFDASGSSGTADASGDAAVNMDAEGSSDGSSGRARRILRFDNAAGPTLLDFPVLLILDPSRIDYSRTRPDAADLHFATASDTPVPHEIESWVPGGVSHVWVRVPVINAGSTSDEIQMFYGGAGRPTPDPHEVWKPSYLLVYHFAEETGASVLVNSADAAYEAAPFGTVQAPGPVGFGRVFQAPADRIQAVGSLPLFHQWPEFTLEMWVYADYEPGALDGDVPRRVLTKGNSLTDGEWIQDGSAPDRADFMLSVIFTDGTALESERRRLPSLLLRTWHHVVYTFDGERFAGFVDGMGVFSVDRPGWALRATSNLLILGDGSAAPAANNGFHGGLDELRVSDVGHSEGWFAAQYRAMTDGGFVLYGPEQGP